MKPSEVVLAPVFGIVVTFLLSSNINCQSCASKPDWCTNDVGGQFLGEACRTIFGFKGLDAGLATFLSLAIGGLLYVVIKAVRPDS